MVGGELGALTASWETVCGLSARWTDQGCKTGSEVASAGGVAGHVNVKRENRMCVERTTARAGGEHDANWRVTAREAQSFCKFCKNRKRARRATKKQTVS